MDTAQSELVHVLSSLEAHWHVLESELKDIVDDIHAVEKQLKKYGEIFRAPLNHLKELKRSKRAAMKDIITSIEQFKETLDGGRRLVKTLQKQVPTSVPRTGTGIQQHGQGKVMIAGASAGAGRTIRS